MTMEHATMAQICQKFLHLGDFVEEYLEGIGAGQVESPFKDHTVWGRTLLAWLLEMGTATAQSTYVLLINRYPRTSYTLPHVGNNSDFSRPGAVNGELSTFNSVVIHRSVYLHLIIILQKMDSYFGERRSTTQSLSPPSPTENFCQSIRFIVPTRRPGRRCVVTAGTALRPRCLLRRQIHPRCLQI